MTPRSDVLYHDIITIACDWRFDLYFDPDFGNCYSFSARGKNGDVLSASEADFWQDENDLILLLDVELEEFNEKRRDPGLVLTVHGVDILPDIHTDGIQVEPGFNYNFAVQQSITKLLPFPYKTNCTDFSTLQWVSEDSFPSPRMCTVRCSQYFQLSNCGFVTERLSMFYSALPWDPDEITEEQKDCARKMERKTKLYCKSLCGLPCEDMRFEVAVDTRHLTNEAVLSFNPRLEMREILRNRRDNLAMVRIYYKSIERKIYEHVPKYDNQELFSYLGGYSGVWLGFSLLNMYELLEIVVATIKFALTKPREQTTSDQKIQKQPFCTQNSKKLFEDVIVTDSLVFVPKNQTLWKLKNRKP
ncbi:hypothetical protein AVEN_126441-1 [Araneus ventricosus]|uniref:Uncharacterized protein n=1 Tax=Araneus ventricosus TaxID=182803 RepID=A0A4Y2DHE7_ARAVE|nr:hypothetical protein AVEN_126441-1 [Araneus ventricosus]